MKQDRADIISCQLFVIDLELKSKTLNKLVKNRITIIRLDELRE